MGDLHRWAVCEVTPAPSFGRRRRYKLRLRSTHKTKTAAVQRSHSGDAVLFTRHLPVRLCWNRPITVIEP